jgi:hypothetical protein
MRFGDIAIEKLIGQQEKLLTVDVDGVVVSTGVAVADISGSSIDQIQSQIDDLSGSTAYLSGAGNQYEIPYFLDGNTLVATSDHTWNESTKVLTINGTIVLSDTDSNVFITNASTPGGIDNVIIGPQAGDGNTGDASVFIGDRAGLNNIATRVIALGSEAANSNEGTECVGVGDDSLKLNLGDRVIGLGGDASREQTGDDVIGLGRSACQLNTGQRVLGWGTNAGYDNEGDDCIFIGPEAGNGNTTDYRFILCAQDSSLNPYILIDGNFDSQTLDLNADITAFTCDISGNSSIGGDATVSGTISVGSLPGGNAGNILTWNASGVLEDSGTSISDAAALIAANASDIGVNASNIASIEDNVKFVENNDVDTGTETLDSITMATGGVWWDVISRKGNNIRSGSIIANVVNSNVEWSFAGFTADNGSTSDISYNVTYSGGDIILQVTASSDNWDVRAFRRSVTY